MAKYAPVDILRKYVMRQCIRHLVETCEQAVWLNLTFWECVTEKEYANKCFKRLRSALVKRYPGFRLVGVWARQKRGAWHIHAVCDRRVDVVWLRNVARRSGFGPQMYLKELDQKTETPEKIARYITGYCTDKNALDSERDKGVRRTIFIGNHVRVVNMRYKSGLKRVVSRGRELAADVAFDERAEMSQFEKDFSLDGRKKSWESWGDWYRRNRDYWFQVGWSSMTEDEQREVVFLDEYTQRYLDTGQWSYV